MNKPKIAATVLTVVALGAAGTGTAFATSGHAAKPSVVRPAIAVVSTATSVPAGPVAQVAASDTDNVQHGDQTTPDVPATPETATVSTPAPAKAAVTASAGETAPEPASTEGTAAESTATDGPGGHQDPAGNVDHQFNGNE